MPVTTITFTRSYDSPARGETPRFTPSALLAALARKYGEPTKSERTETPHTFGTFEVYAPMATNVVYTMSWGLEALDWTKEGPVVLLVTLRGSTSHYTSPANVEAISQVAFQLAHGGPTLKTPKTPIQGSATKF